MLSYMEKPVMFSKVTSLLAITAVLSSCLVTGNVTTGDIPTRSELLKEINENVTRAAKQELPILRYFNGPYVDATPIVYVKGAEILSGFASFSSDGLPFKAAADLLLAQENLLSIYDEDIFSSRLAEPIFFDFKGELREGLDLIAKIAGLSYSYSDNTVRWHQFISRSYPIAVPNGQLTWSMSSGGTSIGSISSSSGGSGESSSGGGGGSEGGSSGGATLGDTGTVNVQSSLDLWADVEKSLAQIIGSRSGATFTSNPAVGSITVTAGAADHELIATYIDELNQELLIRVEIELKILQVTLSEQDQFGIDWSAVLSDAQEGISASYNPGGVTGANNPLLFNSFTNTSQDADSTQFKTEDLSFLFDALATQGEVIISDSPKAITLNNNPVIISDIKQDAYVARTIAGISTGSGDNSVGLEPGFVSTGVQFLIVPKVIGQDIVLQVQTTISTRGEFRTFESSDGTIEAPEVNVSSNNLRVKVKNGSSVIIGGLKRVNHDGSDTTPFYLQALGSTRKSASRSESVLIISARTLEG